MDGKIAVAIDGRAPKFDGGIVTRLDCVPLGIVVNKQCSRFYDEGEDLWPKRYAIWGRLVAQQADQIAYSIIDSKVVGRFMPSVFPPITAASIGELASALGLLPQKLDTTVREFNQAVRPGTFDHQILDNCRTEGLIPTKSHWAQPIEVAIQTDMVVFTRSTTAAFRNSSSTVPPSLLVMVFR